jgi:nicotinamide mononucleotide transporter
MFETAFTLLGTPVTWLETVAFVLAVGCVTCNMFEIHWAWPLAFASALLYALLFWQAKLYGNAGVQVFFALTAVWGWWVWLSARRPGRHERALAVERLPRAAIPVTTGAWLAGWLVLGLLLARGTDSPAPWLDAFPTSGSFVAQVLLALKYVANWPAWLIVNLVSVWLYADQGLWLTTLLYLIFAALSLAGWSRWRRRAG